MADLINDPAQAPKIDQPVRIIHGKQDRVCDPQMSQAFVERMKAGTHSAQWDADKEIDLWDDYEHGATSSRRRLPATGRADAPACPQLSSVMHAYAWGGLGDKYEEKVSAPGAAPRLARAEGTSLTRLSNPNSTPPIQRDRVLQDMHDWLVKKANTSSPALSGATVPEVVVHQA